MTYLQSVSKDFLFKYCTCVYFKNAEAMILEEIDKIKLKFDVQTSVECGNIIQHEIVVKNMKTIVEVIIILFLLYITIQTNYTQIILILNF